MAFGSSFAKFTSRQDVQSDRQLFLRLPEGTTKVIRILDTEEFTYRAIVMQVRIKEERAWRSIAYKTLAKEVRELMQAPGEIRTQLRSVFNVVDRTKDASGHRPNTVHLLDASRTLMEQLVALNNQLVHPSTMKPVSINECDIAITTRKGTPLTRYVYPDLTPAGMEALPDDIMQQRTDPKTVIVFFPPEYQVRLLKGEDYVDLVQELKGKQDYAKAQQEVDELFP